MNDLKFAFRQLLKNPGFIAVAVLTRESGDRKPDDRQSIPKPIRHLAARLPRGSSTSLAPTRPADRFAAAPDANSVELRPPGICGRPNERRVEYHVAVPDRVARKRVCHATSRAAIELRVRSFGKRHGISARFPLNLIQQRAQGRAWARVPDDALPRGVAVQLGEQSRQIRDEPGTLCRSQTLDCRFDFLYGTHAANLPCTPGPGKPASRPFTDDGQLTTDNEP